MPDQLVGDPAPLQPQLTAPWSANTAVAPPGTSLRVTFRDIHFFTNCWVLLRFCEEFQHSYGLQAPVQLSDAMASFCGELRLTLGDTLYRVINYIDMNHCFIAGQPLYIRCDAVLKSLFGFNKLSPWVLLPLVAKHLRPDSIPRRYRKLRTLPMYRLWLYFGSNTCYVLPPKSLASLESTQSIAQGGT